MAYAFQSRNSARVLWPCWAYTFLGRKWILGTVGTVSISHRHNKNVALVSENRGYVVIFEKHISGLTHSIWRQTSQHRRDLRPNCFPVTASFIRPCHLILKGYFSLIILWFSVHCPWDKNLLPLLISLGGGQGLGEGLMLCSRALPQNRCLISHGLEFGHEQFLQATILFSYLIFKGYFSWIFS